MTRKILVLGGTGFVGRSLCTRLITAGDTQLTVPTRRRAAHKDLAMLPGLDLIEADVHDDAALARLVDGQDAVVNLVAILHGTPAAFELAHVDLPRRLAAALRAGPPAGRRPRLVHVSALGVPDPGQPEAPSHYLQSKARGEAALHLASEGGAALDLSVLRPSVIFGAGDALFNLFARLQRWAPAMLLGGAQATMQPVWVEDVTAALQRLLDDPGTAGATFEAVGPQVMTLGDIVRLAGQASGHPRPVLGLPEALAAVQAALLGLVPGEPLLSLDNLRSLRVPNVATGRHPTLAALGVVPASALSVVPGYLDPSTPRKNRWREGAGR